MTEPFNPALRHEKEVGIRSGGETGVMQLIARTTPDSGRFTRALRFTFSAAMPRKSPSTRTAIAESGHFIRSANLKRYKYTGLPVTLSRAMAERRVLFQTTNGLFGSFTAVPLLRQESA